MEGKLHLWIASRVPTRAVMLSHHSGLRQPRHRITEWRQPEPVEGASTSALRQAQAARYRQKHSHFSKLSGG